MLTSRYHRRLLHYIAEREHLCADGHRAPGLPHFLLLLVYLVVSYYEVRVTMCNVIISALTRAAMQVLPWLSIWCYYLCGMLCVFR